MTIQRTMVRMARTSPMHLAKPERRMAYLLSYRMWNLYRLERRGPEPGDYPPRFLQHNIYVGGTVPGNPLGGVPGILFLPEPTIRSMVGLWKSHGQVVAECMEDLPHE